MLARWWRHYWIGLWILFAGPVVAILCWGAANRLFAYDIAEDAALSVVVTGIWLGGALMLVGLAVWAYKFHTEDRAGSF